MDNAQLADLIIEQYQKLSLAIASLSEQLEEIEERMDRLEEAIVNISTPGRNFDVYSDLED